MISLDSRFKDSRAERVWRNAVFLILLFDKLSWINFVQGSNKLVGIFEMELKLALNV